ncbi:DUF4259 domain-containing protein [Cytophagaceae bacterium ABcell3]|nr:DUF4259 domain-containing protein [Cytophagaceae bacterium ABcell3]WMJ75304.1 DUF4259 domain-containing protein [Cytophagaceae bacterium ABcell3]
MGAWSEKNFGNDSALDWVNEFLESPSIDFVQDTLQQVIENDDYIEVDEATSALAAAEVVAALKGKPSSDFPKEIHDNLASLSQPDGLDKLAVQAVNKVISGSELQELWEGDGSIPDPEWRAAINDLLNRLK